MSTRPRILVIDGDPLFRSQVAALLRNDYLVSVAAEGSEGFYKALEHPPHVAIIDVQMSGWDGLKTLQAFRAHPVLAEVKMVILTRDASKGTVMAAIQGGANDYVIKTSFSREDFCEKVRRLIPEAWAEAPPASAAPRHSSAGGAAGEDHAAVLTVSAAHNPHAAVAAAATIAGGRCDDRAARLQQILDEWE